MSLIEEPSRFKGYHFATQRERAKERAAILLHIQSNSGERLNEMGSWAVREFGMSYRCLLSHIHNLETEGLVKVALFRVYSTEQESLAV